MKASPTGDRADAPPGTVGACATATARVAAADEWVRVERLHLDGRYVAAAEVLAPGQRLAGRGLVAAGNDCGVTAGSPSCCPADATRFRVYDPELAATLVDAGAELVEDAPDVEIASPRRAPRRRARWRSSRSSAARRRPPARLVRAPCGPAARCATRVARRACAPRAAPAGLRADVDVLGWDFAHGAACPASPDRRARLAERLPQHALVVGRRGDPAGRPRSRPRSPRRSEAAGIELVPEWASVRSGVVVVVADRAVLRVAIGPTRAQLDGRPAALEALRAAACPPPWPIASRAARARARRPRRLVARAPAGRLAPGAARRARRCSPTASTSSSASAPALARRAPGRPRTRTTAATVAEVAARERGASARWRSGSRHELAGVPRGFAHGDFFAGNLLAEDDRLTGVVDWDAAGSGPPAAARPLPPQADRGAVRRRRRVGPRRARARAALLARAGGDETLRRYCRGSGSSPTRPCSRRSLLAYWLDYAAYQLRTHRHRRLQPRVDRAAT